MAIDFTKEYPKSLREGYKKFEIGSDTYFVSIAQCDKVLRGEFRRNPSPAFEADLSMGEYTNFRRVEDKSTLEILAQLIEGN